MKNPKRLIVDRPTELERLLLEAALSEQPSREHRDAVARALHIAVPSRRRRFTRFVRRIALAALAVLGGALVPT